MSECGICLMIQTSFQELPCKHKLCNTCHSRLLNKICPWCRMPFGPQSMPQQPVTFPPHLTCTYIDDIDIIPLASVFHRRNSIDNNEEIDDNEEMDDIFVFED